MDMASCLRWGPYMSLTPYRTSAPRALALPRLDVSCTDARPCGCELARPRLLFAHRAWRWIWLGVAAFASSAVTFIAVSTALPDGGVDPAPHVFRPNAGVARVAPHASPPYRNWGTGPGSKPDSSLFAGQVHDGNALYDYAQEAKREGAEMTLVDAWIAGDESRYDIASLRDVLGISPRDAIMSVDGYAVDASAYLSPTPNNDYQRHVIEIRRNGRLVVISLRKTRA